MSTFEEVTRIIGEVLQLGDRTRQFDRSTGLMGSIPEFDSMAVVSLIAALEDYFGIMVEDDEISAETFETVGHLCDFIEQKVEA